MGPIGPMEMGTRFERNSMTQDYLHSWRHMEPIFEPDPTPWNWVASEE
jgi:hypothetical protein